MPIPHAADVRIVSLRVRGAGRASANGDPRPDAAQGED
jgi:hypothetical protein